MVQGKQNCPTSGQAHQERGRTQINKIRNEEEETATDTAEIQKPEQNPTNNCLPTNSTN